MRHDLVIRAVKGVDGAHILPLGEWLFPLTDPAARALRRIYSAFLAELGCGQAAGQAGRTRMVRDSAMRLLPQASA